MELWKNSAKMKNRKFLLESENIWSNNELRQLRLWTRALSVTKDLFLVAGICRICFFIPISSDLYEHWCVSRLKCGNNKQQHSFDSDCIQDGAKTRVEGN